MNILLVTHVSGLIFISQFADLTAGKLQLTNAIKAYNTNYYLTIGVTT